MSARENPPANPYAFPRANECQYGMTLRDYFAGQALAGFAGSQSANVYSWVEDRVARSAYEIADAMLAERAKGGAA